MVATKSGSVRGIIQTTAISGIRVQKFLNIPYADAPVGQLRFEKPQPKKPWKGNSPILAWHNETLIFVLWNHKQNKM